jgi:anti-sigma factor RsiW
MDCKEFRERLDLYVDGELSAEEAGAAGEHVQNCASCAKAEAGLRHLRSSLKRVVNRHRPPAGLEGEVLRSLRARGSARAGRAVDESRRDSTHVWRAKVVVPVPFLALLLLAVVALGGWLVFARGPAKLPAPVASKPSAESPGGLDFFSRYYGGERASIKVVRRASPEGLRQ